MSAERRSGTAGQGAGPGRGAGLWATVTSGGVLPLLSAGTAGALMAIQGTFNSVLAKVIGLLETTFLIQLLGAGAAGVLLLVLSHGMGNLRLVGDAPWFTLLAGPIGVAIVYGVAYGIGQAGVARATTAIIIGQVSTAVLIDSLGLFGAEHVPFRWTKLIGVALLAVAGWVMLKR